MFFLQSLPLLSFLLLTASLDALGEPHHNSAFIGEAEQCDMLNAFSTYHTRSFWNKHGKRRSAHNSFDKREYFFYYEYAFNECNSGTFNGGYAKADESMNGRSRSLTDMELSWKHLLYGSDTGTYAFTTQLTGIIPAGNMKSSIRNGRGGFQGSLLYSQVVQLQSCGRIWYDLGAGYRWYEGFPSDQARAAAAFGWEITPWIYLITSGQLEYSLGNGKKDANWNNIAFHPNYRVFNAQIECIFKVISHVFITVGSYRHLWGENVGTGGGFFCGAWLDF